MPAVPPLRGLKQREEMDTAVSVSPAAPSSRTFVSWRASRKRLFRMEEMLPGWRKGGHVSDGGACVQEGGADDGLGTYGSTNPTTYEDWCSGGTAIWDGGGT